MLEGVEYTINASTEEAEPGNPGLLNKKNNKQKKKKKDKKQNKPYSHNISVILKKSEFSL